MTAIIGGRGLHGNFLITDAIVVMNDSSTSNQDCRIKDKITRLPGLKSFATILGDENVLYGIQVLGGWYDQHQKTVDFSNRAVMQEALIAAEKFVNLFKRQGHIQAITNGAIVYFVSNDSFFEYKIRRIGDSYSIEGFRHLDEDEVFLNYGGMILSIENFNVPLDSYFNEGCNRIEEFHRNRKLKAQEGSSLDYLKYEFDNKFSGVILQENGDIKIQPPFKNLSDFIASNANTPELTWKLLNDPDFKWSPKI